MKTVQCPFCNKETDNPKYCSNVCQKSLDRKINLEEMLSSNVDTSKANIRAKKYYIEKYNGCCMLCGLFSWKDQPMPLVLDHIDGHSENNNLDNLRVICNNCDALLPTFKNRNNGNGRVYRLNKTLGTK